jgi:HlyD family secretion protein
VAEHHSKHSFLSSPALDLMLDIQTVPMLCPLDTFRSLVLVSCVIAILGCDTTRTPESRVVAPRRMLALDALGDGSKPAVIAQGKLEPASGIRAVLVPAGDRVAKVNVAEGDMVKAGDPLLELASLKIREAELAVAEAQLRETRSRAAATAKVAQAKLDVATTQLAKAELEMQQAQARFDRAKSSGGELDLLNRQVELNQNKLDQIRAAFNDSSNGRLVSRASLDQQELAVNQAKSAAESALIDAQQSIQRERLSLETARRELEAAKLGVDSSRVDASFESLSQQVELLRLQVESTRVTSPIDAVVLSVDATIGQATTTTPLVYLADISAIVCRAEIDVSEIRKIVIDASAKISSPALSQVLEGQVKSIGRLIGKPQLPSPYPTARVDWRSAEIVIAIDAAVTAEAARFINLQVDVAIDASGEVPIVPVAPAEPAKP